jgi:hypothetical protein
MLQSSPWQALSCSLWSLWLLLPRLLYRSSFCSANALRAAVVACHGEAFIGAGSRITGMNDNEPTIEQLIKVLETEAQKVRLEAIDVAGRLLARTQPHPKYVDPAAQGKHIRIILGWAFHLGGRSLMK